MNEISLEDISFKSAEVGSDEEVDINEGTADSEVESCHSEWKEEKSLSLKRKRAPVLSSSSDKEKFVPAKKEQTTTKFKKKANYSRATNAEECISYILSGKGSSFG